MSYQDKQFYKQMSDEEKREFRDWWLSSSPKARFIGMTIMENPGTTFCPEHQIFIHGPCPGVTHGLHGGS